MHFRDVTNIFKIQFIFHFVKITTLLVGLELETISTGVMRLNNCATCADSPCMATYYVLAVSMFTV